MPDPRIRLLVNPHAGGGAANRRLPEIVAALRHADFSFEIARTSAPGDATALARRSFDDGIDIIAVVGGDGTLNEVAQAYVDANTAEALAGPTIALIPFGTGGDFKRSLGLTGTLENAVMRLRYGQDRPVDLGIMRLIDHAGSPAVRAFVNITSFGIGGITDKLVNETPKWLGGKASFFIGSARALLRYRNSHVRVMADGKPLVDGPVFNVALANGRYFGGSMLIAPDAELSDGLLDIVVLGDLTRVEAVSLSQHIYRGTHLQQRKVFAGRGRDIEAVPAHADDPVLLDMDGETPGRLPIHVRVAPQAIKVRA